MVMDADSTWIVGLVLLFGLMGFQSSHGLTLWNYAEAWRQRRAAQARGQTDLADPMGLQLVW
jgi:hypothetical protein